jgi:two-component system LytT family response regulator
MLSTIIVDDERLNISLLESTLQKYYPELKIIGTAETLHNAFELIINKKPDIIFLDIQLHDQTAFDLIEMLDDDDLNIILITAYEYYGIKAIKYGVVDYLLKPIQMVELTNAIKKIKNKIQLKTSVKQPVIEKEFLHIHSREHIEMLKLVDIIYLAANGSYTDIYLINNVKVVASRPLKYIEEQVQNTNFLRVHNSYIINIYYIEKIIKTKYGRVIMKNGYEIPISATKRKSVAETLGFKTNHLE